MALFKNRIALATLVFKPQREWDLQTVIAVLEDAGLVCEAQSRSTRHGRCDIVQIVTQSSRMLLARTNEDQITIGMETDTDADATLTEMITPLAQNFALSACIWAPKTKSLTFETFDAAVQEARRVRCALPNPIRIIPTPLKEVMTGLAKAGSAILRSLSASPRTDP